MQAVNATKARQNFAEIIDKAQREPILLQRHKKMWLL